ncbi:hypothetical protein L6452_34337 [Arctium lappa]|uniref:Uncharacterized protein n=1 Tax=Arctium lappa TaxID=4217 RepID=A0ACB8YIH5_ARCLA|nr:hypothetical protein L6452_34337 [Arctium lappa]
MREKAELEAERVVRAAELDISEESGEFWRCHMGRSESTRDSEGNDLISQKRPQNLLQEDLIKEREYVVVDASTTKAKALKNVKHEANNLLDVADIPNKERAKLNV